MSLNLNATYWNNRYLQDDFGWDLGSISTPLQTYFDQLTNKEAFILIPGAGNAYEAEYLVNAGFTNVFVCDLAQEPLINLKKRCPSFKEENLLLIDFFNLPGSFRQVKPPQRAADPLKLVAEQVEVAAEPTESVAELVEVLLHNVTSSGVDVTSSGVDVTSSGVEKYDLILEQTFFCALNPSLRKTYFEKTSSLLKLGGKLVGVLFDDVLNTDMPPFGGNKEEYLSYIGPSFKIKVLEPCYNSIKPRAGRELFIILEEQCTL